MRETQEAIEGMWTKLRRYYDKTSKPYAYVDATLLHPALKTRFMKRAGYTDTMIEQYVKETESRYRQHYDLPDVSIQCSQSQPATQRGTQRRPVDSSDSDSSD
jgi:hypothetical protein